MIQISRSELLSDERVLWERQPDQRFVLRPVEFFLIPFSILFTGFAIFWNMAVWSAGAPLFFKIFGLPFLLMGIYVTFGRFVIEKNDRRNTSYIITNKRVIIRRQSGSQAKSIDISRLSALELDERSDGSGTIRFGASAGMFWDYGLRFWQPTFDPTPQFIQIPNVRSVYELIQQQSGR